MSAIVTDQFRILNANNFIESVESDKNSYYVFIGLPNPSTVGYGRSESWNTNMKTKCYQFIWPPGLAHSANDVILIQCPLVPYR